MRSNLWITSINKTLSSKYVQMIKNTKNNWRDGNAHVTKKLSHMSIIHNDLADNKYVVNIGSYQSFFTFSFAKVFFKWHNLIGQFNSLLYFLFQSKRHTFLKQKILINHFKTLNHRVQL